MASIKIFCFIEAKMASIKIFCFIKAKMASAKLFADFLLENYTSWSDNGGFSDVSMIFSNSTDKLIFVQYKEKEKKIAELIF